MPTAAQDLSVTLRLEAKFRPELRKYNNQVVRAFRAEYIKSGNVINLALFDDQLEQLLANHYDRVSGVFNDRISPELPLDVATTEGEREVITAALLIWIASRAKEQAEIINGTTQEEAGLSIEQALDDEIVRTSPDRITAAAVAAVFLNRKLRARETATVMTETGTVVEAAKATEAEVLLGLPPTIGGGSPRRSKVAKEWWSVGDSVVRPAHLSADGQTVPVGEPFTVGGEKLMQPKDMSLGASIDNVANCRCSSIVKTKDVIQERRNGV